MEELLKAIQMLGNRDIIDIIGIFSPIILSVIAIFISIYTMWKQNKIALFEKRYMIISQLRLLITFDNCVSHSYTALSVLSAFDSAFGTDIINIFENSREDAMIKVNNRLKILQNDILMGEFFLHHDYKEKTSEILQITRLIVFNAIDKKPQPDLCKELHNLCEKLKDDYVEELIKKTRL